MLQVGATGIEEEEEDEEEITTHLHLVPRSRKVEPCLHSPISRPGMVPN
jgi:hypothetical protein